MSRTELPSNFPWSKSPRKRRQIVKHDVNLRTKKRLIQDPQNESSIPDGYFSEIRNKIDNVVGEGENGLLRNHTDTSKLESTDQFYKTTGEVLPKLNNLRNCKNYENKWSI